MFTSGYLCNTLKPEEYQNSLPQTEEVLDRKEMDTDHQRCWIPGTWSQRLGGFQQKLDVLKGSTSNLTKRKGKQKVIPKQKRAFNHVFTRWVVVLTGHHELIDLLRAALWSIHTIVFF